MIFCLRRLIPPGLYAVSEVCLFTLHVMLIRFVVPLSWRPLRSKGSTVFATARILVTTVFVLSLLQ